MIKINGVDIPTPSSYNVGIMDISKSERNVRGDILIDRIATKRKIELSWNYLTQSQLQSLLSLVGNVFFTVQYVDPQEGTKTGTFYCGDRKISAIDYSNGVMRWKDIQFNVIER